MNPTAKNALARVMSRKFLITLMALIVVYQTTSLDLASKVIIAVVASSYVICETLLDKGGQARLLELARAAITGPASAGAPPSSAHGVAAIVGALADESLSPDAKQILGAAKHVLEGAVAGMPGSLPPDTVVSPPTRFVDRNDVAKIADTLIDSFGGRLRTPAGGTPVSRGELVEKLTQALAPKEQ